MRLVRTITITAAVVAASAAAASGAGAAPAGSAAAPRQYEGTVVSVNRGDRTFRLRDSERGTVRIKVTARTRYERVNGFAGLRAGMRNIEVRVRRVSGAWNAIEVERSGGGGEHGGGGNDDSGGDDHGGRGRGSDDTGADDNGGDRGRGRGSDD